MSTGADIVPLSQTPNLLACNILKLAYSSILCLIIHLYIYTYATIISRILLTLELSSYWSNLFSFKQHTLIEFHIPILCDRTSVHIIYWYFFNISYFILVDIYLFRCLLFIIVLSLLSGFYFVYSINQRIFILSHAVLCNNNTSSCSVIKSAWIICHLINAFIYLLLWHFNSWGLR